MRCFKRMNRSLTRCIFFLFFLLAISLASTGYSLQIKYYDQRSVSTDYRGVRSFRNPLNDTKRYILNSWDYYIVYFNKRNQIKRILFLQNGNILFEDQYVYNSNYVDKIKTFIAGSIAYTTFLGSQNPSKIRKVIHKNRTYMIYFFSNNKKLTKVELYNHRRKLLTYTKIFYNSRGLQSKLEYYRPNGDISRYVKIDYKNNLKIRESVFSEDDELIRFTTYLYNRRSQLIQANYYDHKGRLLGTSVYEYTEQGQLRYVQRYDRWGRLIVR